MVISTRGLREIWPLSVRTGHYKIFVMSCQPVNQCRDSHNTLQCYQRLDIAVFSYLFLKNSALSKNFLLQAHALPLLVAICTLICQFIHYCVSMQWFCNSHLTVSFGYPSQTSWSIQFLAHPDLMPWVITLQNGSIWGHIYSSRVTWMGNWHNNNKKAHQEQHRWRDYAKS